MLCGKRRIPSADPQPAGGLCHIVDTDARDRRRAMLGKCGGDRFAERPPMMLFFNRDDTAGFFAEAITSSFIKRLDGMDIDDFNADAFFFSVHRQP